MAVNWRDIMSGAAPMPEIPRTGILDQLKWLGDEGGFGSGNWWGGWGGDPGTGEPPAEEPLPGQDPGRPHWPTVREMVGYLPWSGDPVPDETATGGSGGGGSQPSSNTQGYFYTGNVVRPVGFGVPGVEEANLWDSLSPQAVSNRQREEWDDQYFRMYGRMDNGTPVIMAGAPTREEFYAQMQAEADTAAAWLPGNVFSNNPMNDPAYHDYLIEQGILSNATAGTTITTGYSFVDGIPVVDNNGDPDFFVVTDATGNKVTIRNTPQGAAAPGGPLSFYAGADFAQARPVSTGRDDLGDVIYQGNLSDENYQPFLDMVAARIGMSANPVSAAAFNLPVGSLTTFSPSTEGNASDYPGVSFYYTDPRTGVTTAVTGKLEPGKTYQASRDNYDYEGIPVTPDMEALEPGQAVTVTAGTQSFIEYEDIDPAFGISKIVTPDGQVYNTAAEIEALGYIPAGSQVTLVKRKPEGGDAPSEGVAAAAGGWLLGVAGEINDMTPEERQAYSQTEEGRRAWTALTRAGYGFNAQGEVTAPDGSKPSLADAPNTTEPYWNERVGAYQDPKTGLFALGSDATGWRWVPEAQAIAELGGKPPAQEPAGESPSGPSAPTTPSTPTKPTTPSTPTTPAKELAPKDSIVEWLGRDYPPGSLDFGRDGKYEIIIPSSALGSKESDWPSYVDIYEITYDADGNRKRRAVKDGETLDPSGEYVIEVTKTDLDKFKTGRQGLKDKGLI